MNIKIDPHTISRMPKRGVSEEEIFETLKTGAPFEAKNGRKGRAKVFTYKQNYEGKYYEEKKVEVIFVEEDQLITTVTVFCYYGKWED